MIPTYNFSNPDTGNELSIDFTGTPAERGGGDPSNVYCGTRVSFSFHPLNNINKWEDIPLNNIERMDKQDSAVPFTIKDNGFYIIGADIEVVSDSINDFQLKYRVLRNSPEDENIDEVLNDNIRVFKINSPQSHKTYRFKYLRQNDVLTLQTHFSKGEVVINYAALWVFQINEPDKEIKEVNIEEYWNLNEASGVRRNQKAGGNDLLPKNNPGSIVFDTEPVSIFNSKSFQALYSPNVNPVEYKNGFTISGLLKNIISGTSSYGVLAGKWQGNNNSDGDQFLLYKDNILKTFRFAYKEETHVYNYIDTVDDFNENIFNHVAVTYNKSSGFIKLYLNGRLQKSVRTSGFAPSNQNFTVGAYNIDSNNIVEHSDSAISNLSVYNREYSLNEINLLYNNGSILTFSQVIKNFPQEGSTNNNNGLGEVINLPIDSTDINFDNSISNLQNNPSNLQTAIESITNSINSTTFNIKTYQQSIINSNWVLGDGIYVCSIPFSTHLITNPSFFNVEETDENYNWNSSECEISIDNSNKDINIIVNAIPDARFSGRISILGL